MKVSFLEHLKQKKIVFIYFTLHPDQFNIKKMKHAFPLGSTTSLSSKPKYSSFYFVLTSKFILFILKFAHFTFRREIREARGFPSPFLDSHVTRRKAAKFKKERKSCKKFV